MCGIAGILHWDQAPVAPEELGAMVSRLKHRGPDEQNTETPSPGVGLAHCRLKVIDLSSAARQPMTDESGKIRLLFNGEIYNFRELRRELVTAGKPFRSQSDTEVILRAYERWGTGAIHRLEGMFALAIWDGRSQELVLARDRTGKKPLYYWTDGRCVVFGSEIKALLAHPHVPRQIDEQQFPYLLTFGSLPVEETLLRGIRQIPPAALLRLSRARPQPKPETYWKLLSGNQASPASVREAEEELRKLLAAAVKKRLVSDVPLGAFLSGGIDSTIVVGLMSKELEAGQLRTFSAGFEGDARFNETDFARIAADRFQTRHTVFMIPPQPFSLVEKIVWHYDQPFGDSSALPTYLLSQWTRAHVTVALNGDGGDELFAGYDRFQAALLGEKAPGWVWKAARSLFRLAGPSGGHVRSVSHRLRRFLEAADRPLLERYLHWRGIFSKPEDFLLPGLETAAFSPVEKILRDMPKDGRESSLSNLLRLNFVEYLPADLHMKMDRCSMAHGLETRSPFLDTALIEWAFGLADSFKIHGREGKWILRRAFRDLLPEPILKRSKMGFGVPLGAWFRNQWSGPMRDLLLSPDARIHRYLNGKRIEDLVKSHLSGQQDAGHALWLFLTFEIWLRQQ